MKIPIVILAVLGLACGKSLPPVSLENDLNDVVTLLPTQQLFEITLDYLHDDQEVKEFVQHIQSEEFPKFHTFIRYLKDYTEVNVPCFHFFNEHGFDVFEIVLHIHDSLHLPPYEPTNRTYEGVGLHGLVEEVLYVLPIKELKTLLKEKLETREYLKNLVESINSPVFENMLEYVQTWPEYQTLLQVLREKFGNLHHIHELLKDLYWRGNYIIEHELKEIIPLDQTSKILSIVLEYLTSDEDLKDFIVYVQSEKFPKIKKLVEHLKEYKELYLPCLKYTNEYGIDVLETVHEIYPIISEIRVILGLPPLEPTEITRKGVGLPGLIEDIISVLPLEELKVLIEKQVEAKEYFSLLNEYIHSTQFIDMVKSLQQLPEYHDLNEFLREIGVHVERINEIILTLFSLPQF